jgi:hypothetical protein
MTGGMGAWIHANTSRALTTWLFSLMRRSGSTGQRQTEQRLGWEIHTYNDIKLPAPPTAPDAPIVPLQPSFTLFLL